MSTRNSIVSLSSGSTKVETRLADIPSRASLSSHVSGQEGAMIPSSSSKDDDLLSSSSDEIEKMAMQTLEHLEESKPPSLNRFADQNGGRKGDARQDDRLKKAEEPQANIQNEFGVCGWILTILSYLLIFVTLPISACMCIKVVQEYERAVIFRLGRLMPGGAKGPGIFFIVPCIDTYRKVDLRVLSFEVPPQEILSKDSVTVAVDAVVYFRISNATISVTNVEDAARSTKLLAQTTLRNILGTKTLAEMLSDREAISHQMQTTLDEATEPWGVKVERVEVKDVRLPVQLQRAMAAEAEAAREARAKVIVAEGEQKASRALKEAAEVIAESPSALQLRYLQTLNSISAEKNSTIIFPFPIDLLSAFMQRPAPRVEEPPPLPKKIRSCCLYKYPEWVQGMAGEGKHPTQQPPQMCHSHQAAAFGPNTTITSGRAPLLPSFREAHHSAAVQAQMVTTPMPLDPGSLSDSTRSSAWKEMRPQASGGAANSLLKKAIANRLRPIVSSDKEQHEPDRQSPPTDRDIPLKYESVSTVSNDSNAKTASTQQTPKQDEIHSSDISDVQGRSSSNARNEDQIPERQKEPTESANPDRGDREMQERRRKPVTPTILGAKLNQSQDRQTRSPEIVKSRSSLSAGTPRNQTKPTNAGGDASATESRTGADVGRERRQKKLSGHKWGQAAVPRERRGGVSERGPPEKRGGVSERGPPTIHERTLPSPATHSIATSPQSDRPPIPSFSPNPVAHPLPQPSETSPQCTDSHVTLNVLANQRRVRHKGRGRTEWNRRDSSFSESSRFSIASHKSVTFSDRVQLHEIERNELTSSEEDAAIMSDDEMSRRSHQRPRRHIHFYRGEVKHEMEEGGVSQEHTVGAGRGHRQIVNPDDDIEKSDEEEFLQGYPTDTEVSAAMEVLERSGSGSSDLSTIGEKHGSISEHDSQRLVEMRSTAAQTTKRFNNSYPKHNTEYHHLEDTAGVEGLPRSASGYFDEEEEEEEELEEEEDDEEEEDESEEEEEAHQPYPHFLYSGGGSLAADISPSAVRSPLHSRPDNVMEVSTYDNAAEYIQPDSERIRSQVFHEEAQCGQRRHSGSQIRLGAPQNVIPIDETPSQLQEVMRASISLSVDAARAGLEGRNTVEEQMRGQFVARFGAGRRAPVAEEDPCDPVHSMGSLDSVLSTDSRESVVSSVSIRKEAATHRNFKY